MARVLIVIAFWVPACASTPAPDPAPTKTEQDPAIAIMRSIPEPAPCPAAPDDLVRRIDAAQAHVTGAAQRAREVKDIMLLTCLDAKRKELVELRERARRQPDAQLCERAALLQREARSCISVHPR